MPEKTFDVAVLGCGLMGSALARAFGSKGHAVAVWNRTPERAQALSGDSITAIESVDEVVRTSRVVVACTSTYETVRDVLAGVPSWNGTTLVNLTSGAPDEVLEVDQWAHERGIAYLDGAILCFPRQIGTPEGVVLFSGPAEIWSAYGDLLQSLGGLVSLIGEEVHAASVVDGAIVGAFYTPAMCAYIEGAVFARSLGISVTTLRGMTDLAIGLTQTAIGEALDAIDSGDFSTDQATLAVYSEGCHTLLTAMSAAGHHARQLHAAIDGFEAAEAAGLGQLGLYSLAQVAKA